VLFSVLCGVILVAVIYFLARRRYGAGRATVAAAVVALCPIGAFASGRIWMDTPAALATALGLWAWSWALAGRGPGRYVLAGWVAALCVLVKLSNILAAPAYVFLGLEALRRGQRRERWIGVAVFLITGATLVLPWFVWFKLATGHFVPAWTRPSALAMEMYPFMKVALRTAGLLLLPHGPADRAPLPAGDPWHGSSLLARAGLASRHLGAIVSVRPLGARGDRVHVSDAVHDAGPAWVSARRSRDPLGPRTRSAVCALRRTGADHLGGQ